MKWVWKGVERGRFVTVTVTPGWPWPFAASRAFVRDADYSGQVFLAKYGLAGRDIVTRTNFYWPKPFHLFPRLVTFLLWHVARPYLWLLHKAGWIVENESVALQFRKRYAPVWWLIWLEGKLLSRYSRIYREQTVTIEVNR